MRGNTVSTFILSLLLREKNSWILFLIRIWRIDRLAVTEALTYKFQAEPIYCSGSFRASSWLAYSPSGSGSTLTLEFCNEIIEEAEYNPIPLPEYV